MHRQQSNFSARILVNPVGQFPAGFFCLFGFYADNINMADKEKIKKIDLVEQIFQNTNLPKNEISTVLDSLFSEIKDSLCKGCVIALRSFGTFEPILSKGRVNHRNPKTGKIVPDIKPHYVASFKPGKELKQRLCQMEK